MFFFRIIFKVFINIQEYCISGHGLKGTCLTFKLTDLYPYDVIYVNKHIAQCIVGLFGGDAPPLLLTIAACSHYLMYSLII